MTSTDSTIAATITSMCCARPTAVNTESSENTMSMTPICRMISQKLFITPGLRLRTLPAAVPRISMTLFTIRNRPPANRIRSRPETSLPNTENSGRATSPAR